MTRQELMNECDMLHGNINRMMVTDSQEELLEMFAFAHDRLGKLFWENRKRINMKEYKAKRTVDMFDWDNEAQNG